MLTLLCFGQRGFALAYRKSGSGRLRCRTLRRLGFCLTLRFKSSLNAINTKRASIIADPLVFRAERI